MRNLLSRLQSSLLALCALLLVVTGCEKDPQLGDSNLNPGNGLQLQAQDTFSMVAYTVEEEALNSTNVSEVWLGNVAETRTGNSTSSFYAQLRLTQTGIDIGANASLDSIFFNLYYDEIYGPATQTMDIEIYEVTEDIDSDAGYKSDLTLTTDASPLGSISGLVLDEDGGVIKIPLDLVFGDDLLSQIGTSTLESNENFLAYFKGIYVKTTHSNGDGTANVLLQDDDTGLEVYYSSDEPTDSAYTFVIDNQSTIAVNYNHDYMGSNVETALADNTDNDTEGWVMSFSGTKLKIEMPDLSAYEDAVINKAEISFYQTDYGTMLSDDFPEMSNMFLYQNLSDTSFGFLPGFSLSNFTDFGGSKELVSINGMQTHEYTFTITEYIQALIKGELESESLYLTSLSNNSPARVSIGGGSHPQFPIKMNILYTLTE